MNNIIHFTKLVAVNRNSLVDRDIKPGSENG